MDGGKKWERGRKMRERSEKDGREEGRMKERVVRERNECEE